MNVCVCVCERERERYVTYDESPCTKSLKHCDTLQHTATHRTQKSNVTYVNEACHIWVVSIPKITTYATIMTRISSEFLHNFFRISWGFLHVALLQKMACKYKASYGFSPTCIQHVGFELRLWVKKALPYTAQCIIHARHTPVLSQRAAMCCRELGCAAGCCWVLQGAAVHQRSLGPHNSGPYRQWNRYQLSRILKKGMLSTEKMTWSRSSNSLPWCPL